MWYCFLGIFGFSGIGCDCIEVNVGNEDLWGFGYNFGLVVKCGFWLVCGNKGVVILGVNGCCFDYDEEDDY